MYQSKKNNWFRKITPKNIISKIEKYVGTKSSATFDNIIYMNKTIFYGNFSRYK